MPKSPRYNQKQLNEEKKEKEKRWEIKLEKLKAERTEQYLMVRHQKNAINLLKQDIQEKENDIKKLCKRRVENKELFHYLEKQLNDQKREIYLKQRAIDKENEKNLISNFKQTDYFQINEDKLNPLDKYNKITDLFEKFQQIKMDTEKLLYTKEEEIQRLALANFKILLKASLEKVSEPPRGILKRLDEFADKPKRELEAPLARAVLVRVFIHEYTVVAKEAQVQKQLTAKIELQKSLAKSFGVHQNMEYSMDNKLDGSREYLIMSPKNVDEPVQEHDDGENEPDMSHFKTFESTFSFSRISEISNFKKQLVKYWNLEDEQNWALFDDNGEMIDPEESLFDVVYDISVQESKFKDLEALKPPGPKHVILYLGFKSSFQAYHSKFKDAELRLLQYRKEKKTEQEALAEVEGVIEEDEELDTEQQFLQYFPMMSTNYRANSELMKKNKYQKAFKISMGGWIPPTCCSLLINFIQWYLTLRSIMLAKGEPSAFWLPELVRNDLTQHFKKVQGLVTFWEFIQNDFATYTFQNINLKDERLGTIDVEKLTNFNMTTLSQNAKGRLFIGPVRFLQKRVKPKPCKYPSVVERYKKYLEKCYDLYFDEKTQETEDFGTKEWGKFRTTGHERQHGIRMITPNEFYEGNLGIYGDDVGYITDFYPYDMTQEQFKVIIEEMRENGYIQIGPTKMLIIDFQMFHPSNSYYLSVTMLFEFLPSGQIIPTRLDCQPYKMSGFASNNNDSKGFLDVVKFLLNLYNLTIVFQNFQQKKTLRKMLSFDNLSSNFVDMVIIYLQTYTFLVKIQDGFYYDIHPGTLLEEDVRKEYISLHFVARNFMNVAIMETISLIFVATKVIDGARLLERFNVIVLTISQSIQLLGIFLSFQILFFVAVVPLAQSIWGTYLIGYKSYMDALNSVCMLAYSKGNLEVILDINYVWSLNFIMMYYIIVLFILHAAFHQIQTDALKRVVLLFSLKEDDVVEAKREAVVEEFNERKYKMENFRRSVEQVVIILQWLLGWLPAQHVKRISVLNQLAPEYRSSDDEDEQEQIELV